MSKKELINYWKNSGLITDYILLDAFKKVKRENFVLDKSVAYADIAIVGAFGLMVGHPDGHFGVDEVLNRAEAAMLIDRARELLSM